MATLVSEVINDAAIMCGDPKRERTQVADLVAYFNWSQRTICTGFKAFERIDDFDLLITQAEYPYPERMVRLKLLEWNSDPVNSPDAWEEVNEMPEWLARRLIRRQYPTGDPQGYWARPGFFQLIPRPANPVAQGGRISYWALGAEASVTSIDSQMDLPDICRTLLAEGMVPLIKRSRELYDEANADEARWRQSLQDQLTAIEDRSDDANESLRNAGFYNPYRGMV